MNEQIFAREMRKSIQMALPMSHYVKIPDQIYNPRATFNPEKKYDAYVVSGGCFTALEYKLHTSHNAFPFNQLRPIQEVALLEVVEAGAHAYIVIGLRFKQVRKTYFVPIKDYLKMKHNADRKSLPLDELEQCGYPQAEWLGNGQWKFNSALFTYPKISTETKSY